MVTKFDSGDEVLVPVIVTKVMKKYDRIFYEVDDFYDKDGNTVVIDEDLIEGKAKIGVKQFYEDLWRKRETDCKG